MNRNLQLEILELLIDFKSLPTSEISARIGFDNKKVWYEIDQLNNSLRSLSTNALFYHEGNVSLQIKENQFEHALDLVRHKSQIISVAFRHPLILIALFVNKEWMNVAFFEDLLNLSRNTVLNEMRKLKDCLCEHDLLLDFSRQNGYRLIGADDQQVFQVTEAVSTLVTDTNNSQIIDLIYQYVNFRLTTNEVINEISILSQQFNVSFVLERYWEYVHLVTLLSQRDDLELNLEAQTIEYFEKHPLYEFSQLLTKRLNFIKNKDLNIYLTIQLLGAIQGSAHSYKDERFINLANDIIQRINVLTVGALGDEISKTLPNTLYQHLVPAYYRLKYGIKASNPYTEKIKSEYRDLFELVSRALYPLEVLLDKKIPDSEIAYFTIHFGGHIRFSEETTRNLSALILNPRGISTSILLQAQLKMLFPTLAFRVVDSLSKLEEIGINEYDMIFSTIPINNEKEVFHIKPILNWVEQELLIKKVNEVFLLQETNDDYILDNILKIIARHTDIKDKKKLTDELSLQLYKSKFRWEEKNLEELLKQSFIQYTDEKLSWEEAIRVASIPLLKENYIKESYVDAMIETVRKIGPYIVLAPKVAIPHARPEDGANKMGISLLNSTQPISFEFDNSDNDVHLIFVLSAIDNSSHLTALQQLSYLLDDDENIEVMIQEKDREKLYQFILENSKEEN